MRFDSRYLLPGLQVSFTGTSMLGLDVGEAEAAAEQLLLLGQLEDGVGGEDCLEEGGLGGTDGDHTCFQQW